MNKELNDIQHTAPIGWPSCRKFSGCSVMNHSPHQLAHHAALPSADAAILAISTPLLKNLIFVDKIGLGKIIEVGLRCILAINPISLYKQWRQELLCQAIFVKFYLTHSSGNNHG